MEAILLAAAKAVGLPPVLLLSVCYVESSHRNVVSPMDGGSASYGACQVKHATAVMEDKYVQPSDLMRPDVNARIAGLHLRRLLRRYDGDVGCALSAYNSGRAKRARHTPLPLSVQKSLGQFTTSCSTRYARKVWQALEEKPWKAKALVRH
jgi:soluble lytic murein transglycosylase-like protein